MGTTVHSLLSVCSLGPKTPGLIVLEHELSNITVEGFEQSFDLIEQNNWIFQSLALVLGNNSAYFNSDNLNSSTQIPTPTSTSTGSVPPVSSSGL